MLYWPIKWIFAILVAIIVRPQILGRENIPRAGPRIFSSNHLDTLDLILLIIAVPFKLFVEFKEDNKAIMRWLIKTLISGYPVRRFGKSGNPRSLRDGNPGAFHRSDELLQLRKAIYVSPEGHRSDDGNLQKAKPGVGVVIRRHPDALIVPVGVIGTKGILRGGPLKVVLRLLKYFLGRGEKITLIIGAPFKLTEEQRNLSPQEIADLVMTKIAELLPEEQRGCYAALVS